jgi:hypothetical protein
MGSFSSLSVLTQGAKADSIVAVILMAVVLPALPVMPTYVTWDLRMRCSQARV